MLKAPKHVVVGLLFTVIGLAYGTMTLLTLPLGSLLEMGPGYFPLALSSILVVLGIFGAMRGRSDAVGPIPKKPLVIIASAILVFAISVRGLGLFPTVLVTSFMLSFASAASRVRQSVVAALLMAVLTTILFVYLLGLPVPAIGPWLTEW